MRNSTVFHEDHTAGRVSEVQKPPESARAAAVADVAVSIQRHAVRDAVFSYLPSPGTTNELDILSHSPLPFRHAFDPKRLSGMPFAYRDECTDSEVILLDSLLGSSNR